MCANGQEEAYSRQVCTSAACCLACLASCVRSANADAGLIETARSLQSGSFNQLGPRARNCTSEEAGPRAALRRLNLHAMSQAEIGVWRENARIDAILGSCRLSLPSVRSGIRHWMAFIGKPLRSCSSVNCAMCFDCAQMLCIVEGLCISRHRSAISWHGAHFSGLPGHGRIT